MSYAYHDLGKLKAGQIVVVTLKGSAANVRLLDYSNYQNYRAGRQHRGQMGLARQSPVRLKVPRSGHWYVVVDMVGLRGTVRSSVHVEPEPLPAFRQVTERPLSSVPSLVRGSRRAVEEPGRVGILEDDSDDVVFDYDVFVSYASENKDEIVKPLVQALVGNGLKVWYDDFELRIGDSLRRKIDKGLARSRCGLVVLSKEFFRKGWPNYELDGIVTRAVTNEQILLPIWHNVSKQEVIDYSASLADKVARSTSRHTVEEIAEEIAGVIRGAA